MRIVKLVGRTRAEHSTLRWVRPRLTRWMYQWAQRRAVWGGAVVLLALGTGLIVASITAGAIAERASWGELATVAVASRPIGVGDNVAEAIEWLDYPAAVVPALAAVSVSVEDVASVPIGSGEMVVETDIRSSSAGLGAQLPRGRSAMALPRVAGWPELVVGDQVALLATSSIASAQTVSDEAVVLQVDEDVVTLSIVSGDTPAVADALSRGQVVAVLVRRP